MIHTILYHSQHHNKPKKTLPSYWVWHRTGGDPYKHPVQQTFSVTKVQRNQHSVQQRFSMTQDRGWSSALIAISTRRLYWKSHLPSPASEMVGIWREETYVLGNILKNGPAFAMKIGEHGQNGKKWSKWPRMVKIAKNGQNGLKWSIMVPNDPKWSKMVQNGEKRPKWSKMV